MTWDVTIPLGTEAISSGDDRIRELKTDLQTALRGDDVDGVEAKFPGADTANPVYRYRGLKGNTASRPAAGEYGMYFDTTRNVLQRDNGASWDDIATSIPSGTVMVFYQAAAPTGWTKVVTQNDKALRVVSGGTGGASGGTDSIASPPTHIHATVSHVLITAEIPSHTHTFATNGGGAGTKAFANADGTGLGQTTNAAGGGGGHDHGNVSAVTGFSPAYIDVILAQKD